MARPSRACSRWSFFPGATGFFGLCPPCEQRRPDRRSSTDLNAGGDTVAGVSYTVIRSANDEAVTPPSSDFLSGPGVTNILLQGRCSLDQGEHLSMPYDQIADADVLSALDPSHPVTPTCSPVLPVVGG